MEGMEGNDDITLWKRAWRRDNGDVYSTRPYESKEDLLRDLENDGHLVDLPHGNAWCGEPFSFVADKYALQDLEKYKKPNV